MRRQAQAFLRRRERFIPSTSSSVVVRTAIVRLEALRRLLDAQVGHGRTHPADLMVFEAWWGQANELQLHQDSMVAQWATKTCRDLQAIGASR